MSMSVSSILRRRDPTGKARGYAADGPFYVTAAASGGMLRKLGTFGIAGVVVLLAGLALLAFADPLIAAGVALVLAGVGLLARGLVEVALRSMGMQGMF